jgi:hypothetical protein
MTLSFRSRRAPAGSGCREPSLGKACVSALRAFIARLRVRLRYAEISSSLDSACSSHILIH